MIAGLVVARIAGPEVVGIIVYGTAYVSIWGFITGLFGIGHVKLISEGRPLGDSLTTYSVLQVVSVIIYTICVLGIFSYHKFYLSDYFESSTVEIVIILIFLASLVQEIFYVANVTFTAKLEQFKANYPLAIRALLYHLFRILVVVIGLRAVALASVNLLSVIIALPFAWRLLKKLDFGKFNKDIFKSHLTFALPNFLFVVINKVMEYSDKLLLEHYNDAKELGYYSAAFSIGGMFLLVSHSVGLVFFPLFSKLISEKNWTEVNQKIGSFQNFIVLFIFPFVCLLAIIASPFLITLIGEKYIPSVIPFKIILFATYFAIIGMPFGNMIEGMGKFYINVVVNLICLVIFIVSIYLLTNPEYLGLGAIGIAINLLILHFFRNLLYLIFSFRLGELKYKLSLIFPYIIILSITFLFMYYEPQLDAWNSLWWLIISPVYLIIIYSVLHLLGFISRKDINYFIDVLNLRKLINYIKDELGNKT